MTKDRGDWTERSARTDQSRRYKQRKSMNQSKVTLSVFTKPWKMPVPELGEHIRRLGFEGIELPVRPGFQVEPQNVEKDLPRVARQLADYGIRITSVAGPTDEATIAACAEAR